MKEDRERERGTKMTKNESDEQRRHTENVFILTT